MKYRINPKNGDKLSVLGFGCMRFPKDESEVRKLVEYAVESGINYFDTAYVYPNNEAALGRALKATGLRDKIKIATKLPPYLVKKSEDFDKIFSAELSRLQTDRIDYYLIHMLTDVAVWERMVGLGIEKWIEEKKKSGQIINIGFSYHGGRHEFVKIIDAYNWDFCMIQYNYLDENNQAGKSGLEYAASKGLPVMVMEPLRGGKLAVNVPREVAEEFDRSHVKRSPAEWALRWVWNHPEVITVLSGMNTQAALEENIRVAGEAEAGSLSPDDMELVKRVVGIFNSKIKVPCTGCNYCMPCPKGIDIPTCFTCYNISETDGWFKAMRSYMMLTVFNTKDSSASQCVKCGKCEEHCPQGIKIRKEIEGVAKTFEGFYYKPVSYLAKKFMKFS